jgi:hypothetical protein
MRAAPPHLIALLFVMSSFLSHAVIVALTSPHLQVKIATDLGRMMELTETGGPNLLKLGTIHHLLRDLWSPNLTVDNSFELPIMATSDGAEGFLLRCR